MRRREKQTLSAALAVLALLGPAAMPLTNALAGPVRSIEPEPWWEASNCQGIKGVSWIECQKAISRNKRDRKAGQRPSNVAWWAESKCLGLTGISIANCQKALSEAKRRGGAVHDPWTGNRCLGLEGLSFVECQKMRKR
jgi:hypothetical protein